MLEKIYLNCIRHRIEKEVLDCFCREMALAGITVHLCRPKEQPEKPDTENALLITDCVSGGGTAVPVGYGDDYAGSTPYVITKLEGISPQYLRLIYARGRKEPLVIATTRRLLIREMALSDLDALYALYETLSDCPYVEPLYNRDEETIFTQRYIQNMYGFYEYGLWLVFERKTNTLVGRVGLENREIDGNVCQELGYLIGKPWQGRGYAKEACLAALSYGFTELALETVFVCIQNTNKPSAALAKELGFVFYAAGPDGMELYYKSNA